VVGTGDQLRDRSVGALSLQDRWDLADKLTATVGGRFSYVGFLHDTNAFEPTLGLELRRDERTTVRGLVSQRTVVPGGDVLTLSGFSTGPALVFGVMDDHLRPERLSRYELQVDQVLGRTTLVANTFFEGVQDQVLNICEGGMHSLEVRNGGHVATRGMGVSVGRRFGDSVRGSMTYTFGHSWRQDLLGNESPVLAFRQADFHDVAARVETFIEGTDTRVVAFYRLNKLNPERDGPAAAPSLSTRFDVQLSQGLPFLGSFTKGDWDLLLAVRNLFYETSEGGLLDEVAVANPPKRVLGGISVRF
jgi:outer membrane receptor protein involved in Fe transport